eukprot:COSAG01_NODE_2219_length_8143_cov_100.563083_2_plen_87_part_00
MDDESVAVAATPDGILSPLFPLWCSWLAVSGVPRSQAVQTRPHSSQIGSDLPPAAATAPAAVDRLATPAHAHNNSAPRAAAAPACY